MSMNGRQNKSGAKTGRNRRLSLRLSAALLAGGLWGLAGGAAMAASKPLIYCTSDAPAGFDAALYSDLYTAEASAEMVYERLTAFEPGGTAIVPSLAESWDISPDGKTYTFHLRKGVKFQSTPYFKPTRDFNADDVLFSFQRQMDKTNPWYTYEPGQSYQYFDSMDMPNIIQSVSKIDDYTVRFELKHPEAPFLADMAMDFASILSKEYADKLQAAGKMGEMNLKPAGTGPFIMLVNQKNVAVRYRANPDYWRGKQKLNNVVFAIIPDSSVRVQKLKAGECDLIRAPALNEVAGLEADKNIRVIKKPGMDLSFFAFNTVKPPFDKAEVRQALNMAVNRKAISDIIYLGTATMAKTPLPPIIWGYDDSIPPQEYNPEKAREMLAKAGVKNLEFDITTTASSSLIGNPKRLAELLQGDFKKIGVKTNINTVEWTEILRLNNDKNRNGLAMMGWAGDNGDPDNFLGMLFSCKAVGSVNNSFFCNAEYDKITTAAKQNSDIAERTKLYKEAQQILYKEQPMLLLAHAGNSVAMRANIKGFILDPHGISFVGVEKD